eukprot:6208058-Pleurochrysis_carterae.AAC.2
MMSTSRGGGARPTMILRLKVLDDISGVASPNSLISRFRSALSPLYCRALPLSAASGRGGYSRA